MTFYDLEARLLDRLNQKVRSGEISERQLARRAGYTQPHIHNVLKGARRMNRHLADAVLRCLQMSLYDLLDGVVPAGRQGAVPVWRGLVGPRCRFPEPGDPAQCRLFPSFFLSRYGGPVLLRLAPEEGGMSPLIEPGDLVLVDRAEAVRRRPVFDSVYVLSLAGRGAVCRCQQVGGALVLVSEDPRGAGRLPERVSLARSNILDVVQGQVVWTSRELEPSVP